MRNKNKNKLIAFSVLVLCFSCLAFGVYALKNATLTVNGTVGFTAHDCLVNVVAEIEGDGVVAGVPNSHGEPSAKRDLIINKPENSNKMLVGGGTQADWNKTAEIAETIWFTDLTETGAVAEIVMTFTLTNQSAYSVTASIANADIANVRVGASGEITLEKGAQGVLTATFNLDLNANGEYPEINNLPFEVKLDFRKATTGGAGEGGDVGGEEVGKDEEITLPQLEAPKEGTLKEGEVSFSKVSDSAGYAIQLKNKDTGKVEVICVQDTWASISKIFNGETGSYIVSVKALGNGVTNSDSVFTEIGTYEHTYTEFSGILDTPESSFVSGDYLFVCPVSNASGYSARISFEKNEYEVTVEKNFEGIYKLNLKNYLLSQGAPTVGSDKSEGYLVEVKALGDGFTITDSGYCKAGYYTLEEQKIQLSAPTNVVLNTETEVLTFDYVENASEYEIAYFSGEIFISSYQITESGLAILNKPREFGTYTLKIRAKSYDSSVLSSDYVEVAEIVVDESQGMAFSECALDGSEGTGAYKVTGIGECTDTHIVIPSKYNNLPVVAIGDNAFERCFNLSQITIPESVIAIGNKGFYYCTNLSLITIPQGVATIGERTFQGCSSISEFIIPQGVTTIGANAFESCSNLVSIIIQGNVETIGYRAFNSCSSLVSITIPSSVKTIGDYAFQSCSSLNEIKILEGLTTIGFRVFDSCSNLRSIIIPEGVTTIRTGAFNGCTSLSSIKIPSSVITIDETAFSEVATEVEISIAETNPIYYTEGNCIITKENKILIHGFGNSEIPNDVTSISISAFSNCKNLSAITIPSSVKTIEDYAFSGCSSLVEVILPSSITRIGSNAFQLCSNLNKIYYQGTAEQYTAILNNDTTNMEGKVYYYYENQSDLPNDGGQYWHYVTNQTTGEQIPEVWVIE